MLPTATLSETLFGAQNTRCSPGKNSHARRALHLLLLGPSLGQRCFVRFCPFSCRFKNAVVLPQTHYTTKRDIKKDSFLPHALQFPFAILQLPYASPSKESPPHFHMTSLCSNSCSNKLAQSDSVIYKSSGFLPPSFQIRARCWNSMLAVLISCRGEP